MQDVCAAIVTTISRFATTAPVKARDCEYFLEIDFKNNKLRKQLSDGKTLLKSYGSLARKIKQRLLELESADTLAVVAANKALRLHPYKGARKGEWSVDVQQNWRVIFEINHDPAPLLDDGGVDLSSVTRINILAIEDPH